VKKKQIEVESYDPVSVDPSYRASWLDLWVSYEVRRRKVREPCLTIISKDCLEGGIREHAKSLEHAREWLADLIRRTGGVHTKRVEYRREHVEYCEAQLAEHERLRDLVGTGVPFFWEERSTNIYAAAPCLTRATVEEALAWYLHEKGVLRSEPRFRWKRPDLLVVSVGCL